MPSASDNVKLGVCSVLFDGVDLGYTKGGVEVTVETTTHEINVDQFGETPIGEVITGRKVSATVPLAETTLENLVSIMPGSSLVSDGVKASGTVTFSTAAPVNGDKITLAGIDFTFRTVPVLTTDIAIPATIAAAATALALAISASPLGFIAVAAGAVTTISAKTRGTAGNVALAKTFVTAGNATLSGAALAGGVDVTKAKVVVGTGISVNLLSVAKTLVLRPKGTTGEDDFTIFKAACPGALSFKYQTDQERIYNAAFKGYVHDNGTLFAVGDITAV